VRREQTIMRKKKKVNKNEISTLEQLKDFDGSLAIVCFENSRIK
jgi:hypothetical protein